MTMVDPALRATRTTCPYCGVGCGVLATADASGGAAISGDPEHPANFGRLCSKGSALGETLGLEDRLLYPMIRCGKGNMERVAWTGALDHDYIVRHTSGFEDALTRARGIAGSIAATALATGLAEADVTAFFQMFRTTPRVVTLYSQGVNQSAQGTDKVNAIINCHLATGRIGKSGASPFSLTGQPN